MGSKLDMRHRQDPRNIRKDSPWLRQLIERCRDWIFKKGGLIDGVGVTRMLGPESLVPTRVSLTVF
jgi:hypothetical protein